MWPYGRQNRKNNHLWYKFAPKKKSRGSIEKLEHRCTCTTRNHPLCNGTITVLKISLLHSVSITNFVIPKRDRKTKKQTKKHHTFSCTAGARPTIPTILGMVIEEVRPVFAPPDFFDPISSFAARGMGYWKFEGKCPHHRKMLITYLFVSQKQPK